MSTKLHANAAFDAMVEGDDIVVRNTLVTCFGYNDPGDNGDTESGVKNGPDLMGCALPVKHNEIATRGSPIAFDPPIPWGTLVEFWDEANPSTRVTVRLVDNGPNTLEFPDHGGDLCAKPAGVFAPEIPIRMRSRRFAKRLSYRIIGGARFVPSYHPQEAKPGGLVAWWRRHVLGVPA